MMSGIHAYRLVGYLLILVMQAACVNPGRPVESPHHEIAQKQSSERDLDVLEALGRILIARSPWVHVWFVGVADRQDPPPEFLMRFADLPVVMKSLSQVAFIRGTTVHDSEMDREAWILHARVLRWIDNDTAEVEYSTYHGPEAASGGKGLLRRRGGNWTFDETDAWIS